MELNQYEEKMKKSLANLEEEYGAIRAGRANPRILDRIQVDYYGTPTSLQGVANTTISIETKDLTIDLEALLDKLRMIDGVKRLEVLGQV